MIGKIVVSDLDAGNRYLYVATSQSVFVLLTTILLALFGLIASRSFVFGTTFKNAGHVKEETLSCLVGICPFVSTRMVRR